MKRLISSTPQQVVLSEVLTPLKRNHSNAFPSPNISLLGVVPPCYSNIYQSKENDLFFENGQPGKFIPQPEYEEAANFRNYYPFRTQDSFNYGQIASFHRNSFEEKIIEATENKYRQDGLDSILSSRQPELPYRENEFIEILEDPANKNQLEISFEQTQLDQFMDEPELSSPFNSIDQDINNESCAQRDYTSIQTLGNSEPQESEIQENLSNESTNLKIRLRKRNKNYTLLKTTKKLSSKSHSIYKKIRQTKEKSLLKDQSSDKKRQTLTKLSSLSIKSKQLNCQQKPSEAVKQNPQTYKIGPLSLNERVSKVLRYIQKKHSKNTMKKYCYKCRKQVAEKRLRIKGRFVTKSQAFEILGISSAELRGNEIIQRLLENHANSGFNHPMLQLNSLVESEGGLKSIKIRNFQALIDDNYNHNSSNLPKFLTKGNSFVSTDSSLDNFENDPKMDDDLSQQVQLNLRISTTKDIDSTSTNNHVAKVLIQHFASRNALSSYLDAEETLKMKLNYLRLEGYVQPLFKVEKFDKI